MPKPLLWSTSRTESEPKGNRAVTEAAERQLGPERVVGGWPVVSFIEVDSVEFAEIRINPDKKSCTPTRKVGKEPGHFLNKNDSH